MAESFCRFFELKSFLFEFYFFEISLFESSIGSNIVLASVFHFVSLLLFVGRKFHEKAYCETQQRASEREKKREWEGERKREREKERKRERETQRELCLAIK